MFCNINFRLKNKKDLFTIPDSGIKFIVTVNAQFIVIANNDERFMKILNENYATFDGEVPFKIARLSREYRHAQTIKGSEIIYDFAQYAHDHGLKIFLLGGKEQSNKISVEKLNSSYMVKAEGYSPSYEEYPFSDEFIDNCISRIKEFRPDILFVGFGAPKQEFFIDDHLDDFKDIGIRYVIGSGGTFEFFSGSIKRAPKWVSKAGFEGFYRLFQEFNFKRVYRIIFSMKFFKYIFKRPNFEG